MTWEKVLYIDEETGASDLEMDPANPNILYAGMWTFLRQPWTMTSGSEKGGIYKSVDGGSTWKQMTDGLPELLGRICIKAAPSNPQIVWAALESKEGTLYRSEDRGETWSLVSKSSDVVSRGFYYAEMRVDPRNENRIYAISGRLSVSDDGGKSFRRIATSLHGDHHTLWIDPLRPETMVNGNDGGVGISRDRGETWQYIQGFVLSQIYQIGVDNQVPFYRVYGGHQDNGTWGGPVRSRRALGIPKDDWHRVGSGDGFFTVVHWEKPHLLLNDSQGGNIHRFDTRTGRSQSVSPYAVSISGAPASLQDYRFDWAAPIVGSPHDASTVYFGGNVLFKTTDFGTSWEAVSPDLTTNDREKQQDAGGPIAPENTTAEYHCVIISISESPVEPGFVWVGTDDGLVQVTRDGGTTWENVTPQGERFPSDYAISHVEASHADVNRAYMSADGHQLDDYRPYVFKTDDGGKRWVDITDNLPGMDYVHVVREDPKNADVVYVGTETGLFVSLNQGGDWIPLKMANLPTLPVHDIIVHPEENDLLLGTHGRGVWVMDDVHFMQELTRATVASDLHLFTPKKAWRYTPWAARGSADRGGDQKFWGPNPEYGAFVTYYLRSAADDGEHVTVQILNSDNHVIREIDGAGNAGINRVVWDLLVEGPQPRKSGDEDSRYSGPQVLPGRYSVKVNCGELSAEIDLEVALDPELEVPRADLEQQFQTTSEIVRLITELNLTLRKLDYAGEQIENLKKNLSGGKQNRPTEVASALDELAKKITEAKGGIVGEGAAPSRVLERLGSLASMIERGHGAPTKHQREYLEKFRTMQGDAISEADSVLQRDVGTVNQVLQPYGLRILESP
jgi:photosystem II stability/assembly factor-like uncharacterized protein